MNVYCAYLLCLFPLLAAKYIPGYYPSSCLNRRLYSTSMYNSKLDFDDNITPYISTFLQAMQKSKILKGMFESITKKENKHYFYDGAYNLSAAYQMCDNCEHSHSVLAAVEAVPNDINIYLFASKFVKPIELFLDRYHIINSDNCVDIAKNYTKILKESVRAYGRRLNPELYIKGSADSVVKFFSGFGILNDDTLPIMFDYFNREMYSISNFCG